MNRIWLLVIIIVAAILYFVFNKQNVRDAVAEVEQKAETIISEVKEEVNEVKEKAPEKAEGVIHKVEEAAEEAIQEEKKESL